MLSVSPQNSLHIRGRRGCIRLTRYQGFNKVCRVCSNFDGRKEETHRGRDTQRLREGFIDKSAGETHDVLLHTHSKHTNEQKSLCSTAHYTELHLWSEKRHLSGQYFLSLTFSLLWPSFKEEGFSFILSHSGF